MDATGRVVPTHRPLDRGSAAYRPPRDGRLLRRAPVGNVLLVTADLPGAGLWMFDLNDDSVLTPFGTGSVRRAWRSAAAAVSRSVAVLWAGPSEVQMPAGVVQIDYMSRLPDPATKIAMAADVRPEVDGPSFGLSFFLSIVGSCCGVRIRSTVAATATVDPFGRVGPVDDRTLADKLVVIADRAPWVKKVIVAHSQAASAAAIVREMHLGLAVRGVAHAREALPLAMARQPEELLASVGSRSERRSAVVERLFNLSIAFRSALVDWDPATRACDTLLQRESPWGPLTRRERWKLRFVRAVAARRSNNRGELPPLRRRDLAEFEPLHRLSIVAHYIRHGADTGSPTFEEARTYASWVLKSGELLPPHARILGSLGRYCAIRGRVQVAITLQWKAADLLRTTQEAWVESSHQYSELYRLAGVTSDRKLFDRIDRALRARNEDRWKFDHDGSVHVRLARAQALVMLGHPGDAVEVLLALSKCNIVPSNPESSAVRWSVRALDELGRTRYADSLLACVSFSDPRHPVLVRLDRAIRRKEWSTAERCVTALRRIDPGPVRHILEVAPKRLPSRMAFVQRHYPY